MSDEKAKRIHKELEKYNKELKAAHAELQDSEATINHLRKLGKELLIILEHKNEQLANIQAQLVSAKEKEGPKAIELNSSSTKRKRILDQYDKLMDSSDDWASYADTNQDAW